MSLQKFNIASMVMQMQAQKLGLNPFSVSMFALLLTQCDGDANADVKCKQAFKLSLL